MIADEDYEESLPEPQKFTSTFELAIRLMVSLVITIVGLPRSIVMSAASA